MKNIDIKSLIIGVLLTTTIIFGMGATGKDDKGKWDNEQEWLIATTDELKRLGFHTKVQLPRSDGHIEEVEKCTGGWEPYGLLHRKRVK